MPKVFISYSHNPDERWKDRILGHLRVLNAAGLDLSVWDDRRISGGDEWRYEITDAIETCDIALLLISRQFLTSRFIMGEEVPPLLKRRKEGGLRIVPVILSPCQWQHHRWLEPIQARPKDAEPLSGMDEHRAEDALSKLAGEIWDLVKDKVTPHSAPLPAASVPAPAPTRQSPVRSAPGQVIHGRDALLGNLCAALKEADVLAVYGFRGNGKSSLIRALTSQAGSSLGEWPHLDAAIERDVSSLYRRLAERLGDRSERPQRPTGSVEEIAAALRARCPNAAHTVIWIDRAHMWFDRGSWIDPALASFFLALRKAFPSRWRWVFEMRERPVAALLGENVRTFEVPGLDRQALGEWLAAEAPPGEEANWRYSGDQLRAMYQWLGGGGGQHAHPLATSLLVEVALAHGVTPFVALRNVLGTVEGRIELALLADLYHNVLQPHEQRLLQALALYRSAIPHDHFARLEVALQANGAWDALDRRCLLTSESQQERYYIHGFVAGWVRHLLGYPDASEEAGGGDFPQTLRPNQRSHLRTLHREIATCWLADLGARPRVTVPNVTRALEGLHHGLAAGCTAEVGSIAIDLFGGSEAWVVERLWRFDEGLRAGNAPLSEQIAVLELITRINASDHKAWRFLGELLRKTGASTDRQVHCFEQALAGRPDFPPYLANLGHVLLDQGPTGAGAFLERLAQHRQLYPEAINEHVVVIEADCLSLAGRSESASLLRRQRIDEGSPHPALYGAEAAHQLAQGHPDEALRLLDLAAQRGAADAYTDSIRATALERSGNGDKASLLRRRRIDDGSPHPAFYGAEAVYQLAQGQPDEALRLLDLAAQRGVANAYTDSIRATALEQSGKGEKASLLRRQPIDEGSLEPVFYGAEAVYQLEQGHSEDALRLLDLAAQRGIANAYTDSIRAAALERSGKGE